MLGIPTALAPARATVSRFNGFLLFAQTQRITFPRMQITNDLLAHAAFLPGQYVLSSIGYRHLRLTTTPKHHYMIGGVPIIPNTAVGKRRRR